MGMMTVVLLVHGDHSLAWHPAAPGVAAHYTITSPSGTTHYSNGVEAAQAFKKLN